MAEVKSSSKRKNALQLDWGKLLDDDDSPDDHPPELFITPSDKSKRGVGTADEDVDYLWKSDDDIKQMISKHKSYISTYGRKLKDNGEKLKATIRRYEAELTRRNKISQDKDGLKGEETIQLSDQSDDGASCRKDGRDQKSPSTFGYVFSKKIDGNRTVGAFDKELSFFNPRQGKKMSQNGRFSNRGRANQQSSSRSNQFQCPTTLADNKKHKIPNPDLKFNHSAKSSLERFFTIRTPAPQDQPPTKLKPKLYLVDEDIEDPCDSYTKLHAETLSDCMKEVEVYYPSRDDRDPVEVIYTDMECLAPEAYLSSTIMNFYIRYLQQLSSDYRTCNYHFFNTYFYNKLKLNYKEDSFLKFRKWWKGVNIFEKAYILLPVHEGAHWSLGIICIPTKEDELGPIVLHLDSLGLHNSSSIFDKIRRFLKEEWSYLRNSEVPLALPITDEIWENLDHRIIDRKMQVPQQRNAYDCGLFVLYYMERFIKEAPARLTEKNISMIERLNLIIQEMAKEKEEEKERLNEIIAGLVIEKEKDKAEKEAINERMANIEAMIKARF